MQQPDWIKAYPIEIPDDGNERVINVSGGRTSAYMLAGILQAHGGELPDRTRALFANTGKEREETLIFLRRIAEEWNVDIVWLEYRYVREALGGRYNPKNIAIEVDFDTASRDGLPFSQLNNRAGMLLTVVQRKCTAELKVETIARYMRRERGISKYRNVLGMRYDEPKRVLRALQKHSDCQVEHPLFHARQTLYHVDTFWQNASFDLGLLSLEGNCDLCFLKGWKKLRQLIRDDPERAYWWIGQEQMVTSKRDPSKRPVTFHKKYSYIDLLNAVNGQMDFFPVDVDEKDNEPISCFCGD